MNASSWSTLCICQYFRVLRLERCFHTSLISLVLIIKVCYEDPICRGNNLDNSSVIINVIRIRVPAGMLK